MALSGISAMLHVRRAHAAFSPDAAKVVHGQPPSLVVVERVSAQGCRAAVAVNVSGQPVALELPGGYWGRIDAGADLPGSAAHDGDLLAPWGNAWFVEVRWVEVRAVDAARCGLPRTVGAATVLVLTQP